MANKAKDGKGENVMMRIATFIVDKRNLFFLIFAILIIFCMFSKNWVKVENSLSAYLPSTMETSKGLDIMNEEFVTYGTASVVVSNITYSDAVALKDELMNIDHVALIQFDSTTDHYNDFSALFSVTFGYPESDDRCLDILDKVEEKLDSDGYEYSVSTTLGNPSAKTIASEMQVITAMVAVVVVAVLIFTSDSYAEVPVLIATFLVSSALASGTNFFLGTISFVSDSVAVVLQLALSVDYAVILCNKYKYERKFTLDPRSADILALSKAIPEICASSLTTIGGLLAMCFMQFGIGPDMAVVLIKAIILSLVTVFLLMPGLIMLFAKWMDKTKHKSFVPKIPFVGKFAYATRHVIPIIFVFVLAGSFYLSQQVNYAYGYSFLKTNKVSEQTEIDNMIEDTFGSSNFVAVIVPGNDYEKEAQLLKEYESCLEVKSATGLANTIARGGTTLTQKLSSREFAELLDIDKEMGDILYAAYAINDENYAKLITGFSDYRVPFIDMFLFLHDEVSEGYVTLTDSQMQEINDNYESIMVAKNQLQGKDYDRMLIYLNLPKEGTETFNFLDTMHRIAYNIYGSDANVLVTGDATSQYDLYKTFQTDNIVVTVVSMLTVLVVLLFTFKSAGMPVLLIMVIEGCIWVNYSFPVVEGDYVFFIAYLIVSSIQMGANIDYAIVVSSRYQEVKHTMSPREAIIDTMNYAFPTIITSGSMMVVAGFLIGMMTSEPCICGIGEALGRGTIISIFTVLFVLPQILLLGDRIIDKTSFDMNLSIPVTTKKESGIILVRGMVTGYINGYVVGNIRGTVRGEVNLSTVNGEIQSQPDASEQLNEPPKMPQIEENTEKGEKHDETV